MKRRSFIGGALAAAGACLLPWKAETRPQLEARMGVAQNCPGVEAGRQFVQEWRFDGDGIVPTGRWFTVADGQGIEPGKRLWAIEAAGEWVVVGVEC